MTREQLWDIIGDIDDRFIAEAAQYDPKQRSRSPERIGVMSKKRLITFALAAALILALGVTALAAAGALDNILGWFGNQWGASTGKDISEAQAQTIMDLTGEVGLSAKDNGITVTAQSITLGDSSAVLLFTVCIDDVKLSADAKYGFDTFWCDLTSADGQLPGDRGVSQSFYMVDPATNQAYIVVKYDGGLPVADIMRGDCVMSVELGGLVESGVDGAALRNYDGHWEFEIALDADLFPSSLSVESAIVQGKTYVSNFLPSRSVDLKIRDISITSTGISFVMDAGYEGGWSITAVLTDGTKVKTSTGSGYLMPDNEAYAYSFVWQVPISLRELDYIEFYDAKLQLSGD